LLIFINYLLRFDTTGSLATGSGFIFRADHTRA
jgi:hypothetical protein